MTTLTKTTAKKRIEKIKSSSVKKPLRTKSAKPEKAKLIEKSAAVAQYYGFTVIPAPAIQKDDHGKVKNLLEIDLSKQDNADEHHLAIHPEEKVALLRTYLEQNMQAWNQPVMLYYEDHREKDFHIFHLDMLGTTKSIAEATLIKTAFEILRGEGYENLMVHINSIGDRDSMARFCRELGNYYRKHIESLSPHCRQLLKRDPYEIFECRNEKCQAVRENAPTTVGYLTEPSRQHFREVLEYLETLGIPYKIDNTLVCSKKMWSQTAFEIRMITPETEIAPIAEKGIPAMEIVEKLPGAEVLTAETVIPEKSAELPLAAIAAEKPASIPHTNTRPGLLLAVGMRYNTISKKIGFRKEIGAIGVTISYKKAKSSEKPSAKSAKKFLTPAMKTPRIYFIQLGFDAKLKSLQVIEMLRQENIPIAQSLGRDKIGGQIQSAEIGNIPYTIIMGQKEARENTVIVREMSTRSQEIVSLDRLSTYLKKIK